MRARGSKLEPDSPIHVSPMPAWPLSRKHHSATGLRLRFWQMVQNVSKKRAVATKFGVPPLSDPRKYGLAGCDSRVTGQASKTQQTVAVE